MYPKDEQFEDDAITEVEKNPGGGWSIKRGTGWSFYVPAESPIEPKAGSKVRFYGKGFGFPVRGLFIDGKEVYYFTEADYKVKQEIDMFGASPADWLDRWDRGDTVWSIEMGGLGPGYEQCIHITAAEILRHLIVKQYDPRTWEDKSQWERDRDEIEKMGFANPVVKDLGLSGAQWGAAMNLAINFYRNGPRGVLTDERVKDRHIQVSKGFPQATASTHG